LFEYEEILKRNQEMLKLSDRAVEDVLNGICSRGECRKIHFLWRPQLSDPKDDHVLELAVAASGADIVTHNVNDFTEASSFGIRIITPAQLLGELR
jgi:predicted nucleic acid-binding protein